MEPMERLYGPSYEVMLRINRLSEVKQYGSQFGSLLGEDADGNMVVEAGGLLHRISQSQFDRDWEID